MLVGDGGGAYYNVSSSELLLSSVDNGSVIALSNSLYAVAAFGGSINPVLFGAKVEDHTAASSNVTAMNSMFSYIQDIPRNEPSPYISFPSGTYYINDTVNLPIKRVENKDYFIDLQGSMIRMADDGTSGYMFARSHPDPTSKTDSGVDYMEGRVVLKNGTFYGNGKCSAINIQCTYNSTVSDILFRNVDKGIHLEFCLNALVDRCRGGSFVRGIILDRGSWAAATNHNTQCNASRVIACRLYCSTNLRGLGTQRAIEVHHSNMCRIDACIIEGEQPSNAIYYSANNTTVKRLWITGLHLEVVDGCLDTAIRIDGAQGGKVYIEDLYHQYAETPMVDATNSNNYCNIIYSPAYYATVRSTGRRLTTFKTTHSTSNNNNAGVVWRFTEPVPIKVMYEEAYWEEGIGTNNGMPYYKSHHKDLVTDEFTGPRKLQYVTDANEVSSSLAMGYQTIVMDADRLTFGSERIFNDGLSATDTRKLEIRWKEIDAEGDTKWRTGYIEVKH